MAETVTNVLSATVTSTDNSGNVCVNRNIGSPSFAGTLGTLISGQKIPNADTNLNPQLSPIKQLYIKNLSATSTVTIKWTPNGGVSATILNLTAGGFIGFWDVGAAQGITAITANHATANEQIEYFFGG